MVKINPEGAGTPSFNGVFRRPSAKKPESHQASLETLTCFPELKARVQAGWPSQRVADYIETTYPAEYAGLGMVKGELIDHLNSFRKALTPLETVAIRMPAEVIKAKEKIDAGLDIMAEMQELYAIQKGRINIDVGTEKKLNKLFKTTGNEIAIAAALLRDLAAIMGDLGVNKGNPGEEAAVRKQLITDFGLKYGKDSVAKVLNDPRAVSKVLGVAESLFKSIRAGDVAGLLAEVQAEEKPAMIELQVIEKNEEVLEGVGA
jgi:hypothetical protein